jgi:hypothetical protein
MDQIVSHAPQAIRIAQIAFACFFSVLFLQSGLDKLMNFRENLSWLVNHFSKTFLSAVVPVLFILLTLCELSAGVVSGYGIIELIIHKSSTVAYYGAALSVLALLFLFFGQRIAKDYGGASGIVSYFIASVLALILMA